MAAGGSSWTLGYKEAVFSGYVARMGTGRSS